mmetsp:Transcript_11870/g.31713  ORF Transcript_11870/g.31713 Transcript_11870/m.31713 type:complete len:221 (+) Transcript_11870:2746-3408(+)
MSSSAALAAAERSLHSASACCSLRSASAPSSSAALTLLSAVALSAWSSAILLAAASSLPFRPVASVVSRCMSRWSFCSLLSTSAFLNSKWRTRRATSSSAALPLLSAVTFSTCSSATLLAAASSLNFRHAASVINRCMSKWSCCCLLSASTFLAAWAAVSDSATTVRAFACSSMARISVAAALAPLSAICTSIRSSATLLAAASSSDFRPAAWAVSCSMS